MPNFQRHWFSPSTYPLRIAIFQTALWFASPARIPCGHLPAKLHAGPVPNHRRIEAVPLRGVQSRRHVVLDTQVLDLKKSLALQTQHVLLDSSINLGRPTRSIRGKNTCTKFNGFAQDWLAWQRSLSESTCGLEQIYPIEM